MLKYLNIIVEKIVNILIFIIFVAILFCLYNIFCLRVLNHDYVNVFGYSIFEVATGSMGEAIEISDAVVVKINDEYEVGDVVTYQNGKDFITHRVIEEEDDYIITKGDANNTADNPIDKKLVLGKVVHVVRDVGVWKEVLLTPKVIMLIFATLFTFSILFAYNGKKIKITVGSDKDLEDGTFEVDERMQKRRNRKKIKKLEFTQVFAPVNDNDVVYSKIEDKKKKTLDCTQVIDINEIKNLKNSKKKTLDYTQVIDLKDIKNGDRNV